MTLLLYTDISVSELMSIRTRKLDLVVSKLRVVGKGSKSVKIPLRSEAAETIREYMVTERKG